MLNIKSIFKEAVQQASKGYLSSALDKFTQIYCQGSSSVRYNSLINMSTIKSQSGFPQQAFKLLEQAKQIDPFSYIAYYNCFVIGYSLNQIQQNEQYLKMAYENLVIALSCINVQICAKIMSEYHKQNQQEVSKLVKKSLSYCENNALAYLLRGWMYQMMGKYRLAQNDYDMAQDYCKDYSLIYLFRSQFLFRSIHKQTNMTRKKNLSIKLQNDLKQYHKLLSKEQTSFKILLKSEVSQLSKIQQLYQEFSNNLYYFKNTSKSHSQLQNKVQQQQVKNSDIVNRTSKRIDELFNVRNSEQQEQTIRDSSNNISAQIQKLQKQIKNQKGVNLDASENINKSQSQSETFLTVQIQKAARDIEQFKKQTQANSPRIKPLSDVLSSNSSYSSKTGRRIINQQQLKQFETAQVQIVSAQIFQDASKTAGRSGSIILKYHNQNNKQISLSTSSKTEFIWHEKFKIPFSHLLNEDNTQQNLKIEIIFQLSAKSIWSSKLLIGKGNISLLQMGQNQCLLMKSEQKTGMVYYKLKLQ